MVEDCLAGGIRLPCFSGLVVIGVKPTDFLPRNPGCRVPERCLKSSPTSLRRLRTKILQLRKIGCNLRKGKYQVRHLKFGNHNRYDPTVRNELLGGKLLPRFAPPPRIPRVESGHGETSADKLSRFREVGQFPTRNNLNQQVAGSRSFDRTCQDLSLASVSGHLTKQLVLRSAANDMNGLNGNDPVALRDCPKRLRIARRDFPTRSE